MAGALRPWCPKGGGGAAEFGGDDAELEVGPEMPGSLWDRNSAASLTASEWLLW